MTPLRRRILILAAKLFDLVLMVFSFGLATVLVAHQTAAASLGQFFSMRIKVTNFVIFARLLSGVAHRLHLARGLRLEAIIVALEGVFDVAKASRWGLASSSRGDPAAHQMVTPLLHPDFLGKLHVCGSSQPSVLRPMLKRLRRRGHNLRQMVVIGTNARALRFARKIEASPELGYRIPASLTSPGRVMGMFEQTGYPLVADLPASRASCASRWWTK